MAERKSKGDGTATKRGKRSKPDVIDVGDKPEPEAEKDSDAEEGEGEGEGEGGEGSSEEGLDTDLASAAGGAIDVGEEPATTDEEVDSAVESAAAAKAARGGSLARRDPMAV
jgi:hypothetical protein